jgi:uncharacterized delta-60 repeat protein
MRAINRVRAGLAVLAASASAVAFVAGVPPAQAASTPGSVDATFGNSGSTVTDLGLNPAGSPIQAVPTAAVVLANGDILVAGNFGVVRFLADGSLDKAFGSNGLAAVGFQGNSGIGPEGVAVQPDGKVIWAGGNAITPSPGQDSTTFAVERFRANGTPDPTFGNGGMVSTDFPTQGQGLETAQAVVVQPNGKILVGGFTLVSAYRSSTESTALVRYNSDGTVDPTFGNGGQVVSAPGGVRTIGLDSAGNIFVLPGEAEFSPTGHRAAAVTASPIIASSAGGPNLFLANGQTLQGGSVFVIRHDNDAVVRRFNANGALDTSFANPAIDYNGQEFAGSAGVSGLAVQPNGQILLGGGLARVNGNGTVDTAFANGGSELTTFPSLCLLQLPNGRAMSVGYVSNTTTGGTDLTLTRFFE